MNNIDYSWEDLVKLQSKTSSKELLKGNKNTKKQRTKKENKIIKLIIEADKLDKKLNSGSKLSRYQRIELSKQILEKRREVTKLQKEMGRM